MAKSETPDDINVFLDNAAWAICSTYHTVLKCFPGMAIFRRDIVADLNKIVDHRQRQTNLNSAHENSTQVDYNYMVDGKVLLKQDGYPPQSRKPIQQKAMDYCNNFYE
jgi:hypothetical protein